MTGPEHYQAAEGMLSRLQNAWDTQTMVPVPEVNAIIAGAQVHATLALAAATAHSRGFDWDAVGV